ncbi:hypothetical protein D3C81_1735280 [compost metagenome]
MPRDADSSPRRHVQRVAIPILAGYEITADGEPRRRCLRCPGLQLPVALGSIGTHSPQQRKRQLLAAKIFEIRPVKNIRPQTHNRTEILRRQDVRIAESREQPVRRHKMHQHLEHLLQGPAIFHGRDIQLLQECHQLVQVPHDDLVVIGARFELHTVLIYVLPDITGELLHAVRQPIPGSFQFRQQK